MGADLSFLPLFRESTPDLISGEVRGHQELFENNGTAWQCLGFAELSFLTALNIRPSCINVSRLVNTSAITAKN
jgi:hypothetical protein